MNKYVSRYSNNKEVSAAQYITEIICEKKAKKDNIDLHYRFWTSKKWDVFYRSQIGTANKLLQKYPAKAIINALLCIDSNKIFSLRAPHLIPIIEEQAHILTTQNSDFTKDIKRDNKTFSRSTTTKNNIISKLEDIDNDS